MIGIKTAPRRSAGDEAEKPFWISYSDLMTALMVLFLVAMSVALFSITNVTVTGPELHKRKIDACMAEIAVMTKDGFPGIGVKGYSIDFGTLALFDTDKHKFKKPERESDPTAEATLRAYVPKVLGLTRSKGCNDVFKRVIVEGFASQSGTYIHNLNLSLQRAERVLCALLDPANKDSLPESDRKDVRNLFLVGGSSFNALKPSAAESQRVELKLEFLSYGEEREHIRDAPIDQTMQCPLDR